MTDRLPPHDTNSEMAVIGCCLLTPVDSIPEAQREIGPDFFYDIRCREVWVAINEMQIDKVDCIAVSRAGTNVQYEFLNQCMDIVHSSANLPMWIDILKDCYTKRKAIRICTSLISDAYNPKQSAVSLLDRAERDILSIRPMNSETRDIKTLVGDALAKLEKLFGSKGSISGLSTGLIDLDRMTDGLHGGEMIVIAAYPSCGKSTLAAGIAVENAIAGNPVGFCSFEMRPVQLVVRAICSQSRVNLYDVRDGHVSESQFAHMNSAAVKLSKAPIYIENCNGMTIGQVIAIARRMKQRQGIRLLVIDYIQLVSCPGADSREQEVSQISKGIKAIAMELDIPVIALSQLNDDGKLRESRAIGQDADSVWQIEPGEPGSGSAFGQPVELIVKKARDGAVGAVDLVFIKQITRFESVAKVDPSDVPSDR